MKKALNEKDSVQYILSLSFCFIKSLKPQNNISADIDSILKEKKIFTFTCLWPKCISIYIQEQRTLKKIDKNFGKGKKKEFQNIVVNKLIFKTPMTTNKVISAIK